MQKLTACVKQPFKCLHFIELAHYKTVIILRKKYAITLWTYLLTQNMAKREHFLFRSFSSVNISSTNTQLYNKPRPETYRSKSDEEKLIHT